MQFGGPAPAAETDFDGAQHVHVPRGAGAQPCSAVVVPSEPPCLAGSFDVGGGHELSAMENTFSGTQFCGTGVMLPGPICRAGSAGACTGDVRHPPRDVVAAQRQHSGGGQRHGRRAGSGAAAGFGQQARCERAEAGSCLDSDVLLSVRVENPSARVARVNTALHQNSCSTPARSLHGVHVARCVYNSMNSLGNGVVRERDFCVPGGTKSLSTCTRTGVRRPAVEKLASPQQASLKVHEETWAGLLKNQVLKISQEVEIVPGCAVRVARPSCPDYYPEPPGPGIVIRNMLGWSLLEKTERSGVWLFRSALQGKNLFSLLDAAGDWERKGSYRTAWAVPCNSSCSCSYAYGHGPAIRPHTGERCWSLLAGVWRAIAPLMLPWCAEGEVPTAREPELLPGMEIVCWLALRRRTFIWKVWGCQTHCICESW